MPTQEKKKKKMLRNYPTAFSPTGGLVATQEKKSAKKLGNMRKVSKPHKMIAQRPAPPPPPKLPYKSRNLQ